MERINQRNRGVESGISMDYLRSLHKEYETFITNISRTIPVIKVSWEKYRNVEEMAAVIEKEYLQGSFLREVEWSPTAP
jgi:deoxyadenosine kinase